MVYKFNNEIYYQYLGKGKYPDLKYVQKIIPKWNSYLGMFKHCNILYGKNEITLER